MRRSSLLANRSGCISPALKALGTLALVFLFRYELGLIIQVFRFFSAGDAPRVELPPTEIWAPQLLFFAGSLIAYLTFAWFLSYLIAGGLLPLRPDQRSAFISRFRSFLLGSKLAVIRVREGRLLIEPPPGKSIAGGIALVDPNSAIVLERTSLSTRSKAPFARVGKPGVVFIRSDERLLGVVSLRKQARSNANVKAQTSDGIEVTSKGVSVVFTLGQPPAVVKVAYEGEQIQAHAIRVIRIDPNTKKIIAIVDELDMADKNEIHAYASQFLRSQETAVQLEPDDFTPEYPPFPIDEQRIKTRYMPLHGVRTKKKANTGPICQR